MVFIAGGVGINPLISILSHLAAEAEVSFHVTFIYSFRHPGAGSDEKILFEERLQEIFGVGNVKGELEIHRTPGRAQSDDKQDIRVSEMVVFRDRRVVEKDIFKALGPVASRGGTICYICGVPTMTDQFVETVVNAEGMARDRVLFERWW